MLDNTSQIKLGCEIHRLCDLFSKGEIRKVLQEALQLQETFPKSAALFILIGDVYTKLKQYNNAIENYKTGIEIQPNFAHSYFNLGIAFEETGDLETAIGNYEKAISLKPNYAEAYHNLGVLLRIKGNKKAAIKKFKTAIRLKPTLAESYLNLGLELRDQGNLEAAIAYFKDAISNKTGYVEAYLNLGDSFRSLGNLEAAILSYSDVKTLIQDDTRAHEGIGISIRYYTRATYNGIIERIEKVEELIEIEQQKLKACVKEKDIWFIDIPSTSSTAIKILLGKELGWPFGQSNFRYKNKTTKIERSYLLPDHTPAFIAKRYLGEKLWERIRSFAVVRNPYSWCASLWHFAMKNNHLGLEIDTFDNFLGSFEEKLVGQVEGREIYPSSYMQSDYLLDNDGKILPKNLLKYEDKISLAHFLKSNCKIDYLKAPRFIETKSSDYWITSDEQKKIERIFKKDFEVLGY